MVNNVYHSKLLELAGNIPRIGRLDAPDATASAHAKLCGSKLTLDVKVDANGAITDFAQEVKACALGQAAASAVASDVIGADLVDVREAHDAMTAMLKNDGPTPEGRFEALGALEAVREYPARHASTMLVLDALVDALEQVAHARSAA